MTDTARLTDQILAFLNDVLRKSSKEQDNNTLHDNNSSGYLVDNNDNHNNIDQYTLTSLSTRIIRNHLEKTHNSDLSSDPELKNSVNQLIKQLYEDFMNEHDPNAWNTPPHTTTTVKSELIAEQEQNDHLLALQLQALDQTRPSRSSRRAS